MKGHEAKRSGLHIKGHDGDHEEIEQQFRQILGNPAVPARDRVRLSCALGALLSSLMSVSELGGSQPRDLWRPAARGHHRLARLLEWRWASVRAPNVVR